MKQIEQILTKIEDLLGDVHNDEEYYSLSNLKGFVQEIAGKEAIDYEQKYKEAYNRVSLKFGTLVADEIFPELKKSEDERMINFIKECVSELSKVNEDNIEFNTRCYDALAWLEKQGEQKHVVVIPKFRVGDEIKTANEEPLTITKIDKKGYWSEDLFICGFDDAAKWELVEQKPVEWSEEDEKMRQETIDWLEQKCFPYALENENPARESINWLKSLRPQKQWKPTEEQMKTLDWVVKYDTAINPVRRDIIKELLEQIKKL